MLNHQASALCNGYSVNDKFWIVPMWLNVAFDSEPEHILALLALVFWMTYNVCHCCVRMNVTM